MSLSVIIPSRLQVRRGGPDLWLPRALRSVLDQADAPAMEIVVGLDPGVAAPAARFPEVHAWASGAQPGQAAALNAAIDASTGDPVAILEDDDRWHPERVRLALPWLDAVEFVSSNQRELAPDDAFVRINDFATPSGWLFRRDVWKRCGPFDVAIRYHIDNDFLGRVHLQEVSRVHLVEAGGVAQDREWLKLIAARSRVEETGISVPLVDRTVNPDGGIETTKRNRTAALASKKDMRLIIKRYRCVPW